MKVYTHEDVLKMLRSFHNLEMNVQLCILKLTPIDMEEKLLEYWNGGIKSTEEGGKSFDQYHIVDTNEMVEKSGKPINLISSQTEISDESWEGCDGCTEQDEVMYKNGYVKGYNVAISELHKEISDEEIQAEAIKRSFKYRDSALFENIWEEAIEWYREQLKNKQ